MNTEHIESVGIQFYRRSQGYRSQNEALRDGALYGGEVVQGYSAAIDTLHLARSLANCMDHKSPEEDVVACLCIAGVSGVRKVEKTLTNAPSALDAYLKDAAVSAIHPDNTLVVMLRQTNMDPDQESCRTTIDLCWFPVKYVEVFTDRIEFLQAGTDIRGDVTQRGEDWVLGNGRYEFCFVEPIDWWRSRGQFMIEVPTEAVWEVSAQ